MVSVLEVVVWWVVISVPLALLAGAFLSFGSRRPPSPHDVPPPERPDDRAAAESPSRARTLRGRVRELLSRR